MARILFICCRELSEAIVVKHLSFCSDILTHLLYMKIYYCIVTVSEEKNMNTNIIIRANEIIELHCQKKCKNGAIIV